MKRRSLLFALSAALLLWPLHTRAAEDSPRKLVVAYVPNWIDLPTFAETIEYERLTHINIAFENPVTDAGDFSHSPKNEALIRKAKEKGVKILLSIGGGAASGDKKLTARYFDLLTDAKRPAFAAKLADHVIAKGFDGLDVDIEGPAINKDYGAFIQDLAAVLKPKGKLLTSALSKGYGGDSVPDFALPLFDFVNIMAYDGAGYWSPDRPGQHSSFAYAKDNVAYWLNRGLPKSKAVLGLPFYGYGFGEAFRKRDWPYAHVLREFPGSENADQAGSTVWYNGIPTIKAKTAWAMEEGLAGVMIWSLDSDVKDERSLLKALDQTLRPTPPK